MTPEEKQKIFETLERRESLILIHWPQGEVGKARLLVEIAQDMRESGALVAITDLSVLGPEPRFSLKDFYLALASAWRRNGTHRATRRSLG